MRTLEALNPEQENSQGPGGVEKEEWILDGLAHHGTRSALVPLPTQKQTAGGGGGARPGGARADSDSELVEAAGGGAYVP